MPLPMERPASGSRFGPSTISAMTRTMMSSMGPTLNGMVVALPLGRDGLASGYRRERAAPTGIAHQRARADHRSDARSLPPGGPLEHREVLRVAGHDGGQRPDDAGLLE